MARSGNHLSSGTLGSMTLSLPNETSGVILILGISFAVGGVLNIITCRETEFHSVVGLISVNKFVHVSKFQSMLKALSTC